MSRLKNVSCCLDLCLARLCCVVLCCAVLCCSLLCFCIAAPSWLACSCLHFAFFLSRLCSESPPFHFVVSSPSRLLSDPQFHTLIHDPFLSNLLSPAPTCAFMDSSSFIIHPSLSPVDFTSSLLFPHHGVARKRGVIMVLRLCRLTGHPAVHILVSV